MDLGLDLNETVVVVTGGGGQIGQIIVQAFLSAGSRVAAFDIDDAKFTQQHENLLWLKVDTTNESAMEEGWNKVTSHFGHAPTACVCAAGLDLSFVPRHSSAKDLSVEQFRRTLDVNTVGTFITAKLWLKYLHQHMDEKKKDSATPSDPARNASCVIIGSEAGVWGVAGNPDYAASKSAIQYGLTLSLAPDAARICPWARVNAISPGAVNTAAFRRECAEDTTGLMQWTEAGATNASKQPTEIDAIARLCLVLASQRWSGSTSGQNLKVDAGKTGRLYWDHQGKALW